LQLRRTRTDNNCSGERRVAGAELLPSAGGCHFRRDETNGVCIGVREEGRECSVRRVDASTGFRDSAEVNRGPRRFLGRRCGGLVKDDSRTCRSGGRPQTPWPYHALVPSVAPPGQPHGLGMAAPLDGEVAGTLGAAARATGVATVSRTIAKSTCVFFICEPLSELWNDDASGGAPAMWAKALLSCVCPATRTSANVHPFSANITTVSFATRAGARTGACR